MAERLERSLSTPRFYGAAGCGLEIHRAARPLGVRIPRPPPTYTTPLRREEAPLCRTFAESRRVTLSPPSLLLSTTPSKRLKRAPREAERPSGAWLGRLCGAHLASIPPPSDRSTVRTHFPFAWCYLCLACLL